MMSSNSTTRRQPRFWSVAITSLALVLAGVVVATPAHAAADYVGEDSDGNNGYWENRTLPAMVEGEPYNESITGPQLSGGEATSYSWSLEGELPAGLDLSGVNGPTVTISGTPTEDGVFSFTLVAYLSSEETYRLVFAEIFVESGKIDTVTVVDSGDVYPASSVDFSADVTDADGLEVSGGTVQFSLGGTAIGGSIPVVDGVATLSILVDTSFVGDRTVTADYSGNDYYKPSTGSKTVTVYRGNQVSGVVSINGVPQAGVTVKLIADDTPPTSTDTTVTVGDGSYLFELVISSEDDAKREYTITAVFDADTERSWNSAGTPDGADSTGPMNWDGTSHDIGLAVPPVWTDTAIATPRRGVAYSSDIAAANGPVTYSVTGGALPTGLTLDADTGLIEGTPDCLETPADLGCPYSFTVTADNGYGSVTHLFSGNILEPGIPPTWTPDSDTVWDLQETIPFSGAVDAEGDPVIHYSVTAGALPKGLVLDETTGAITGTPECSIPIGIGDPCEYTVTITATNDYGSVDQVFAGTIEAQPAIDLTLEFASGTPIDLAESTISGGGLKVGSTYTLEMFSTPVLLYTGTIDASGGFSWRVGLPVGTPPGAHRLLLTGIAPDGTVLTAEAWFTLLSDGTIGDISYSGPVAMPGLPDTGVDATAPLTSAILLTLIGMGLLRRRRMAD